MSLIKKLFLKRKTFSFCVGQADSKVPTKKGAFGTLGVMEDYKVGPSPLSKGDHKKGPKLQSPVTTTNSFSSARELCKRLFWTRASLCQAEIFGRPMVFVGF